jgi:hypothetical protein
VHFFISPFFQTPFDDQSTLTHEEIRRSICIVDSSIHRETKELIPLPFRRSAMVVAGIPLNIGLLSQAASHSIPWLIFWQWANQTYNCGSTYFNRSASNSMTDGEIFASYMLSSSTSALVGSALILSWRRMAALRASGNRPPTLLRTFALSLVPTLSAISANSVTVIFTRWNELRHGISVFHTSAPHPVGKEIGKSKQAGYDAVWKTVQSRALLSCIALLPPPILMYSIAKTNLFQRYPLAFPPIRIAAAAMSLTLALPISLAPWPQFSPMCVTKLESDVADRAIEWGLERVYFNRGI